MTRPLVLIFFPFMEMFNDIHHLLTKDAIRDRRVVDIYKEVSDVTRDDDSICNNSPELNSPSISDNVHLEFNNLIGSSYQIETNFKLRLKAILRRQLRQRVYCKICQIVLGSKLKLRQV